MRAYALYARRWPRGDSVKTRPRGVNDCSVGTLVRVYVCVIVSDVFRFIFFSRVYSRKGLLLEIALCRGMCGGCERFVNFHGFVPKNIVGRNFIKLL